MNVAQVYKFDSPRNPKTEMPKGMSRINRELEECNLTLEAYRAFGSLCQRAKPMEINGEECWVAFPSLDRIADDCFRGSYPDSPKPSLRRKAFWAIAELEDRRFIAIDKSHRNNRYIIRSSDEWIKDAVKWRSTTRKNTNVRKSPSNSKRKKRSDHPMITSSLNPVGTVIPAASDHPVIRSDFQNLEPDHGVITSRFNPIAAVLSAASDHGVIRCDNPASDHTATPQCDHTAMPDLITGRSLSKPIEVNPVEVIREREIFPSVNDLSDHGVITLRDSAVDDDESIEAEIHYEWTIEGAECGVGDAECGVGDADGLNSGPNSNALENDWLTANWEDYVPGAFGTSPEFFDYVLAKVQQAIRTGKPIGAPQEYALGWVRKQGKDRLYPEWLKRQSPAHPDAEQGLFFGAVPSEGIGVVAAIDVIRIYWKDLQLGWNDSRLLAWMAKAQAVQHFDLPERSQGWYSYPDWVVVQLAADLETTIKRQFQKR